MSTTGKLNAWVVTYILTLLGGIALVLYMNQSHKTELSTYISEVKDLREKIQTVTKQNATVLETVGKMQAQHEKDQAVNDSLTREITASQRKAVVLTRKVTQLSDKLVQSDSTPADSISTLLGIVDLQADVITEKTAIIDTQAEQIKLTKRLYAEALSSVENLTTSLEESQAALKAVPKPPKNPDKIFFGLIPKPSRIVSAIGGVGFGIIGTLAAIR